MPRAGAPFAGSIVRSLHAKSAAGAMRLCAALLGALAGASRPASATWAWEGTTPGSGAGSVAAAWAAWAALPAAAFILSLFARRYVLPSIERTLAIQRDKTRLHAYVVLFGFLCGGFEAFSLGWNQARAAPWVRIGVPGTGWFVAAGWLAASTSAAVLASSRRTRHLSLLDSAFAALLCGGLALAAAGLGAWAPPPLHGAAALFGIAWEKGWTFKRKSGAWTRAMATNTPGEALAGRES